MLLLVTENMGKQRLMNIKVFGINEQNVIGYKRAFSRKQFGFLANTILIAYSAAATYNGITGNKEWHYKSNSGVIGSTMSIWFMLELVTMFLDSKPRALHDLIAGSVVIDINEMEREELQRRHQELMNTPQKQMKSDMTS